MNPVEVLDRDPDVVCCRCPSGRLAEVSVELDATTDGTPVAELWCRPCLDDWSAT